MENIPIYLLIGIIIISIAIYYSSQKTIIRNSILLLTSFFLYIYLEGLQISILFFIILITYIFSKQLIKHPNRLVLGISIFIVLIFLILYKYIFVINSELRIEKLPIGLSFYTFQSISYLVDSYHRKTKKDQTIIEIGIYLAFFPKILAGPLENGNSFIQQLRNRKTFKKSTAFTSLKIIIWALCCKFVFADSLGMIVNNHLTEYQTLSPSAIISTSLLYSFQILCDFYSYSIFAIGIALLYGINLSANFNYPYFSASFKDFWKKWNITLTSWLREYIYIPLGGNKVSFIRWSLNIFIVFILSGIWHGASFNFILWGFLHGLCYWIESASIKLISNHLFIKKLFKQLYAFIVFIIISFLWLIFRIEDFEVLKMLLVRVLIHFSFESIPFYDFLLVFVFSFGVIMLKRLQIIETYIFRTQNHSCFIIKEVGLINIILFLLIFFAKNGNSNFIYFNY